MDFPRNIYIYIYNDKKIPDFEHIPDIQQISVSTYVPGRQHNSSTRSNFGIEEEFIGGPEYACQEPKDVCQ